ncbi:MAG TPA: sigma-70 family RNA polymerase sigma factor [Egicoccus sp.]|nr:sigma-70 family RNA polymerase sigma factor [Egicoccus sp.]HSK22881.1 sigma-70 family RNA polymerase sigma factor [Egicoccus sp.]
MTNAAEDAELLADVAAGDQRAAAALYDTYAPILYGYGLHRLGDAELAEELVQRVLWTLCRRAARYDATRGPVRAFVFAIAGSTVVDLQRQAARRPAPVGVVDAGTEVADAADRVVAAATVRAALLRLGEDHRRVLELAYDRGLSQREIAQALALPLGTVKSRTYYALQAFRLACEELGVKP